MYACFSPPLPLSLSLTHVFFFFFLTPGLEVQGSVSLGRAPYPWRISISIFLPIVGKRFCCLRSRAASIATDDIQMTEFLKCTR